MIPQGKGESMIGRWGSKGEKVTENPPDRVRYVSQWRRKWASAGSLGRQVPIKRQKLGRKFLIFFLRFIWTLVTMVTIGFAWVTGTRSTTGKDRYQGVAGAFPGRSDSRSTFRFFQRAGGPI